jgi:hypothetical protein
MNGDRRFSARLFFEDFFTFAIPFCRTEEPCQYSMDYLKLAAELVDAKYLRVHRRCLS